MKTASIITCLFGLFLIALAIGLFQSTINAKDDDIIFYIFGIIFSGFGGFCLLLAGIADYNKSNQNKNVECPICGTKHFFSNEQHKENQQGASKK